MSHRKGRKPRALIAMSHPQRRQHLAQLLREDGWTAVVVENGYELIGRMADALLDDRARRPDLIIADATMAGCSGTSLLEGIRQLHWVTPFFLITDFARPGAAAEALAVGPTQVFEKPIDVHVVCAAARATLRAAAQTAPGPACC